MNDCFFYLVFLYLGFLLVEVNNVSVVFLKYDGKNKYMVVIDICLNLWFVEVFVIFNLLFYKVL